MPESCTSISVIIPALNEELYIGPTLEAVRNAIAQLKEREACEVDVIVVDNGSTDRTAEISRDQGATVVDAPKGNVAMARNAGARAATGEILVFVDADTIWPATLLCHLVDAMSDPKCVGGAVDTDYRPKKIFVRWYLRFWRILGRLFRMAQGATQFCQAELFASIDGYDENVFMGEDVDFYSRLRKAARKQGSHVTLIDEVKVVPSCRRFDQWSFFKTVALTNPLTCLLFSKRKKPWGGWYATPPR